MKRVSKFLLAIFISIFLAFGEYLFLYKNEDIKKHKEIQKQQLLQDKQTNQQLKQKQLNNILNTQTINEMFVEIAYNEIGNIGGYKYKSALGMNIESNWCAAFVSWCIKQIGYDTCDVLPVCVSTTLFENWFKDNNLFFANTIIPEPGMVILFDFGNGVDETYRDGFCDHVGIVEKSEDGFVYVIEGNYNNAVCENVYTLDDINILGYGKPSFDESKLDKLMKLNVV